MATIRIDSDQFIVDSIKRNAFQTHMVDNYDLLVTDRISEIPAKIKTLIKKNSTGNFLEGAKCKYVAFRAKDENAASEDNKLKIANFMKTVFFISADSSFGVDDIVRIVCEKSGKTFFFVKIEMVK